jgi:hypothetical protein
MKKNIKWITAKSMRIYTLKTLSSNMCDFSRSRYTLYIAMVVVTIARQYKSASPSPLNLKVSTSNNLKIVCNKKG